VALPEIRIQEAKKLGFETFYLPAPNRKHLKDLESKLKGALHWISNVRDLDESVRAAHKSDAPRQGKSNGAQAQPVPGIETVTEFDLY
jgi:hypothetical protein